VQLPQGKTLHIENTTTQIARSIAFNGHPIAATTISHADLLAGGHLRFS